MHYTSIFISDIHLGLRSSRNAQKLIEFLNLNTFDRLFLVGDVIDFISISVHPFWYKINTELLKTLLDIAENKSVVYITGNHDDLEFLHGKIYANISFVKECEHRTKNGLFWICHGHEFDKFADKDSKFAVAVSVIQNVLITLDSLMSLFRKFFNIKREWSIGKTIEWIEKKVSKGYDVEGFERRLFREAKARGYQGVICGHLHDPMWHRKDGIDHYNCGDLLSNMSILVEIPEGEDEGFEILYL